jgi:hypothetical protein
LGQEILNSIGSVRRVVFEVLVSVELLGDRRTGGDQLKKNADYRRC